jgi:hypothetical protein
LAATADGVELADPGSTKEFGVPREGKPIVQPSRRKAMSYIDGFVIAVPTANKQKFIDHARHFDALFIELGARRVIESWGDDVPDGKLTARVRHQTAISRVFRQQALLESTT